ncbi:MAG TPA: DNA topoisomerase IV subunit B, partial [Bacteroidetes bacterium]|nr:DNA topoisomerase IV subunit B [Bacteroidota bacterium]
DADVDGAHIAALLITFFYRSMPETIRQGRLFMALPPLYRISAGPIGEYARDDAHRDELLATEGYRPEQVEVGRFKGLGEMNPEQLWSTTMNPETRTVLQVSIENAADADRTFSILMGDEVEPRREFIEKNAKYVRNLDV